ncbi:MAG: hypothetical protein QOH63_2501 [Acidobacteriota bacterium]|jgi:hypothetical protein|nr:hypothetical protein [Acidobacteriota bacterium]
MQISIRAYNWKMVNIYAVLIIIVQAMSRPYFYVSPLKSSNKIGDIRSLTLNKSLLAKLLCHENIVIQ